MMKGVKSTMKLKIFDIYEMLEGISSERMSIVIHEIAPFCLYVKLNGMGICLVEQKDNILNVIRRHGEELGIKVRVKGHFVNLSSQLVGENVDWEDIWLGDILVNSRDFMYELGLIISCCEERLLEAECFETEWKTIKKEALKRVLDKWHKERVREIDNQYEKMIYEWTQLENVPLI
ncbi:hypothetical protein NDS46_31515 (plasmid) [Paenibacillus thiaminolyticus]|uniref:hypothetical protein n=1 Tax=Paenibacillus thiaminolyticus TaxID=49283 RepID=UPI00232F844B|nr:hypothetical protein [Paenibacillus thiaminolyticus]WCF11487.1 hypothetical protein NDS46_31515 [Paenibacillus thiaminolyticus]